MPDDLAPLSGRLAFSLKEAGTLLGLSPTSIRRALGRGELEAVRIGGRLRVTAASLRRLMGAAR